MSDETPDPIAAFDQILAGIADVAKVMHKYYDALREQGFTDAQAIALTLNFQAALVSSWWSS